MKKYLCRLLAAICTAGLLLAPASALTVEQALELLEDTYVDPIPPAAYEAGTLDELFQILGDPYTYYMTAEEYQDHPRRGGGGGRPGRRRYHRGH